MNKKHLINACRVSRKETPWDFSRAFGVVGFLSLICALAGTLIWGFGDLWL